MGSVNRNYKYAIIDGKTVDVTTYYRQVNQLVLTDPCSHPDQIRCGTTRTFFVVKTIQRVIIIYSTEQIQ
jgi:hypothetical protein